MRWQGQLWFLVFSVLALISETYAVTQDIRALDALALLLALLGVLHLRPARRTWP
ncbi:hypothetical protein [Deinococcus peraridilitoris]|nr:hypothetical protein [Deinococcus peraridilitoris]